MTAVRVTCAACGLGGSATAVSLDDVAVDASSPCTWLPARPLRLAGVRSRGRRTVVAAGSTAAVDRRVGPALLRVSSFQAVDDVVFAEDGDPIVVGASTLRAWGARADARGKRLERRVPRPIAVTRETDDRSGR